MRLAEAMLFVGALAGPFAGAGAETAWVIDKLLVGVHEEQALESPILKVLPTGTEVEVLAREGELARIRDPDGREGWVDAGYLMDEPPAALRLEELQGELERARARLNERDDARPGAAENGPGEALAALREEKAALEQRLASERLKVGQLQARISALNAAGTEAPEHVAGRLASLRGANERLRAELERARDEARADSPAGAGGEDALAAVGWRLLHSKAVAFTLVGLLALAFGAGAWFMDYLTRRRHGGFRV